MENPSRDGKQTCASRGIWVLCVNKYQGHGSERNTSPRWTDYALQAELQNQKSTDGLLSGNLMLHLSSRMFPVLILH